MKKLGDLIRVKRKQMKLTQGEFGTLVGDSQKTVSDWETGNTATIRNYEKVAELLGLPVDDIVDMMARSAIESGKLSRLAPAVKARVDMLLHANQNEVRSDKGMAERDVPVYGRAQGGPDGMFEFNGEIMGWATRPVSLIGVREAYAIYVDGESMYPRYKPGETVWIHPGRPFGRYDDVIVQLHPDEEDGVPFGFIKEFRAWTQTHLVLFQHNPSGEVRYARERVKSVHRIVHAER